VTPRSATIGVGQALQLTATAYDSQGRALQGAVFAWSSSDQFVASVDSSGVVTGVYSGRATITATEVDSGVSGTATIAVIEY